MCEPMLAELEERLYAGFAAICDLVRVSESMARASQGFVLDYLLESRSELAIAPVYKWTRGGVMVPRDTDLTNLPAKEYIIGFSIFETIGCILPHAYLEVPADEHDVG